MLDCSDSDLDYKAILTGYDEAQANLDRAEIARLTTEIRETATRRALLSERLHAWEEQQVEQDLRSFAAAT